MGRKRLIRLALLAAVIVLAFIVLDERLLIRRYEVEAEQVTAPVRLAVLTDFHGCRYGKDGMQLVTVVAEEAPDAILLVGDMFSPDGDVAEELRMFAALAEIAPAYYVTGNHEFWEYDVPALLLKIAETGVTVLADAGVVVELNGQRISLCGIHDQSAIHYLGADKTIQRVRDAVKQADEDAFTILLTHRPELAWVYETSKCVDLIFAGHAHGGQVRIPGVLNGLYAPNQGWFPAYAGGKYDLEGMTMIVSRGLSRYRMPPRVFNRPEILLVTVK